MKGAGTELRVRWASGHEEWAKESNVRKDANDLVEEFYSKKVAAENNKKEKGDGKPRAEQAPRVKKCSREHSKFELGTQYKEEPNAKYFDEKQQLHETNCLACHVPMVAKGVSEKGVQFKPTAKKPAYACLGRENDGCLVVVCGNCFFNQASGTVGVASRRATKRKRA